MSNQMFKQGLPAEGLLRDGPQTVQPDNLTLGQYFGDENVTYRWAHIAATAWKAGTCFKKNQYFDGKLAITSACFSNAVSIAKNRKDINAAHVFGLSGLTAAIAAKLVDGHLFITCGNGIGRYDITYAETGKDVTVASGGGTTQIYLKQSLPIKLSTGTTGYLVPNEWYGMTADEGVPIESGGYAVKGGASVSSGAQSGYALVQTRGPGIAYAGGACVSGVLCVAATSGHLSSVPSVPITSDATPIVAIALTGGVSNTHFAVDWKFEGGI